MQRFALRPNGSTSYDSSTDRPYVSKWEVPSSQREASSSYRPVARCRSYPSCRHKLDTRSGQFDLLNRGAPLSRLQTRFDELALRWKRETRVMSSSSQVFSNESFRRIVGLGEIVLPLVLGELRKTNDLDWVETLSEIAGFQFVNRNANAGDLLESWLDWGREQGLVN